MIRIFFSGYSDDEVETLGELLSECENIMLERCPKGGNCIGCKYRLLCQDLEEARRYSSKSLEKRWKSNEILK